MSHRAPPLAAGSGVRICTPGLAMSFQLLIASGFPGRTSNTTAEVAVIPWSGACVQSCVISPASWINSMSGARDRAAMSAGKPFTTFCACVVLPPKEVGNRPRCRSPVVRSIERHRAAGASASVGTVSRGLHGYQSPCAVVNDIRRSDSYVGTGSSQADLLRHLDLHDLAVLHDQQDRAELQLAEDLDHLADDDALFVGELVQVARSLLGHGGVTLLQRPLPSDVAIYQAYASGAGPPGPGKIRSSARIVRSSSVISSTRSAPSSCSIVRGPMIGAVTTGFASSHARATSAGFSPRSAQSFSYACQSSSQSAGR